MSCVTIYSVIGFLNSINFSSLLLTSKEVKHDEMLALLLHFSTDTKQEEHNRLM